MNQVQVQKSELADLAALLAELKIKWPNVYRQVIGIIKAVNDVKR